MKKVLVFTLFIHSLFALEFGSMGNTSAAMGGAGVALKHSPWGLYYNPALLSADPKTKLAYSVGIGLKEQNLAKIATINVSNISKGLEQLVGTFGGNGANVGAITDVVKNALNSVLTSSGQTPTGDVQKDLETYLKNNTNGNYNDLIQGVLSAVQSSNSLSQAQKDLLGSLAGSIDYGNLEFGGNSGGVSGLLENITISKGANSGLDQAVESINIVQDILKNNNLSISSQNGVILQLSGKTMNERLGSLGVALFVSAYSSMSIKADSSKLRLIIDGGNGSYYELIDNGNNFSYRASNKNDYDQFSLLASLQGNSDAHKLIATSFVLTEIPVGYARTFYLKNGNLNIGITGKLMNAISLQNSININANTNFQKEFSSFSLSHAINTKNYGIDVGILYELDLPNFRYLTLGLVGKNLNSPSFQSTLSAITIKPQYRLGIGYNSKYFDFAFDADLLPNDLIAFSNIKQQSQMVGGGVAFNLRAMDIRLGAMKDLRQDNGLILTGGLNALGFLDIALQSSTSFTKAGKYAFPQYLNVRVGASFSF